MQIGFTTTTFRQIKDVKKIVTLAKEAGVDCIEWGGDIHVKDVKTAVFVKELCDKEDIAVCSYGSYYRVGSGNTEEWKRICEIASTLGAKAVRVWLGKKDSEKTDKRTYEEIVKDAKEMCRIAKEFSLTVCPECHDNTYNNNTDAFLKIEKDIGMENFRTYFQSRYKKKEYDLDRIKRTLPFIEGVHISYSEQRREQFPKYDPSYINTLLDKLIEEGFDGNLLLEYTYIWGRWGLPSCMKKDIQKLKNKVGVKK
ncbi:MAG: TIM barrel protein [Clostridia bacterium]|nr:TIM barrel protein [Clostridia bacterium]